MWATKPNVHNKIDYEHSAIYYKADLQWRYLRMKELRDYRRFMKKEEMHKSLNSLIGILEGVLADNDISEAEESEINNWYSLHEHLLNVYPFSEFLPAIQLAFLDGILDIEEVENILWLCKKFVDTEQENLYFNIITSKIQQLEGILHGIVADGNISETEIQNLSTWLDANEHLVGMYPFDEVCSLLLAAKEDGIISNDEKNMLKAFFSTFVDTAESYNINNEDVLRLQQEYSIGGICAVCPEITFPNEQFCFTGASKKATRNQIAHIIESAGGIYNDRVTENTKYLIVGADGNPCWAYSCYGRKVEKAMDLRKKGKNIIIVHEYDFWDEI